MLLRIKKLNQQTAPGPASARGACVARTPGCRRPALKTGAGKRLPGILSAPAPREPSLIPLFVRWRQSPPNRAAGV